MSKILVIDDDEKLAETVQDTLTRTGFIVDYANCAEEADPMLAGFVYDLIILDWVMPGMHGIDYLAKLRARGLTTPVLMLTGQSGIDHKLTGLDQGADDYLTKPFDLRELLARVRALMRRPVTATSKELKASNVAIELLSQRVTFHEVEVKLTKQEYQLLELLMRNKNEVFSQEALCERAWSSMSESSPEAVRVHIFRIRKKFETASKLSECPVRTLHGKGYIFVSA